MLPGNVFNVSYALQFLAHVIAYISIIYCRKKRINNFCETRPTTHALTTKTFAWQFDMFFGACLI